MMSIQQSNHDRVSQEMHFVYYWTSEVDGRQCWECTVCSTGGSVPKDGDPELAAEKAHGDTPIGTTSSPHSRPPTMVPPAERTYYNATAPPRGCICEHVDVGIGWVRVAEWEECPVHGYDSGGWCICANWKPGEFIDLNGFRRDWLPEGDEINPSCELHGI